MMAVFSAFRKILGRVTLPEQWADQCLLHLPLLALDLELTSLDAKESKITSVGWVCGKHYTCQLETANHHVIRAAGSLAQSPAIHGLTQEKIAQGKKVTKIIDTLLPLMSSHVLVLHHAGLDMAVLKKVFQKLDVDLPPLLVIDTLCLCKYLLEKSASVIKQDSLTLSSCRTRFELPAINAHNALDDAIATLELWYACQNTMKITPQQSLRTLLHTGALKVYEL